MARSASENVIPPKEQFIGEHLEIAVFFTFFQKSFSHLPHQDAMGVAFIIHEQNKRYKEISEKYENLKNKVFYCFIRQKITIFWRQKI